MTFAHRYLAGFALAIALTIPAAAVQPPAVPASLFVELEAWLDANSEYQRRASPPKIVFIAESTVATLRGTTGTAGGRIRGLYDDTVATIYLAEPWSPEDPLDVSTLLHELVHHRQVTAQHWYCSQEQEWRAYQLQEAWLSGRGIEADFYWPAIALSSSCTPRDIHPD